MLLDLQKSCKLTPEEKQEIDVLIETALERHKGNSAEINKLTMDSVFALTVCEARANALANQGFVKRIWGGITGGNQKLRADVDYNITKVQYASQNMIQKLAEQNLLTLEIVTAVINKLNTQDIELRELNEEINQVYQTIIAFFKQVSSDVIQMEARVVERFEKLERNDELFYWHATFKTDEFEEVGYKELPDIFKIVCLSNDFFLCTKGEWSTRDLRLLKSALDELGLDLKANISIEYFYKVLIEKPSLIERLFKGISFEGLDTTETYEAPLVKGIEKLKKLNNEEEYIYEAIAIPFQTEDLQLAIVHLYLLINGKMDICDAEINLFDLVVELLIELQMVNFSVSTIDHVQISYAQSEIPEGESLYYKGHFKEAYECFQRDLTHNSPREMYYLGTILEEGLGRVPKNYLLALDIYKKGADLGDPFCRYANEMSIIDEGSEEVFKEVLNSLLPMGEKGDKVAQCIIGILCQYGRGIEFDDTKALIWFEKSAEQGYFAAQASLASTYACGMGVEEDYKKALEWALLSANQGHNWSENFIGDLYYYGYGGVEKDYTKARLWYGKAASNGNKASMDSLSTIYEYGRGVTVDSSKAAYWRNLSW